MNIGPLLDTDFNATSNIGRAMVSYWLPILIKGQILVQLWVRIERLCFYGNAIE